MSSKVACLSRWFVLALALFLPRQGFAAWPSDPSVNVPVCTAAGDQSTLCGVSDGAGGAIFAWTDGRDAARRIYAQHLRWDGAPDPVWPVDGRALCTAAAGQSSAQILSDGTGGAFIVWQDYRLDPAQNTGDIYAQRVGANGSLVPGWPSDGLAVCRAVGKQETPRLVSDGSGGAIVAWLDNRGGSDWWPCAQHLLSGGTTDPAWPVDGQIVNNWTNTSQTEIALVSDGAGGAIVEWFYVRGGHVGLVSQRIGASGVVAWPYESAACQWGIGKLGLSPVPDGAGGALLTWLDYGTDYIVGGPTFPSAWSDRILADGSRDPAWPRTGTLNAVLVSGEEYGPKNELKAVSDGAGGALSCWSYRYYSPGYTTYYGIRMRRVTVQGGVQWSGQGLPLSFTSGSQQYPSWAGDQTSPSIVSDDAGGAVVAWQDSRNGNWDIYAQHARAGGTIDPAWTQAGRPVSTNAATQTEPVVVTDGAAGAIIAWLDRRNGNSDVYAQHIQADGQLGGNVPTPTTLLMLDASSSRDGITVRWQLVDPADYRAVTVERAEREGGPYVTLDVEPENLGGVMTAVDNGVADGHEYWYRIVAVDRTGGVQTFGPIAAAAAGARMGEFSLSRLAPNPATGPLSIEFTLPRAGRVHLDVADPQGRLVATLADGPFAAGSQRVGWDCQTDRGRALAGIYFVRMMAGGQTFTRRLVLVR